MMALSDYVIGRTASRKAFESGQPFKVSCYRRFTVSGREQRRYADPSPLTGRSTPNVVYRIRVRPKA